MQVKSYYTIYHLDGQSLSAETCKKTTLHINKECLAGICSILFLLSLEDTYAVIKGTDGVTVDTKNILSQNYFFHPQGGRKHYCHLRHYLNGCVFQFDSKHFVQGIKIICKILDRRDKDFLMASDFVKKIALTHLTRSDSNLHRLEFRDERNISY
jgi:hypothetical protein